MAPFGSAIGGGSEIQQAMARRGMGGSVMNQQSPASPGFSPVPTSPSGGGGMPPQSAAPSPTPTPQGMGGGVPGINPTPSDDQLIIKALSEKMRSNSDIAKAQAGLR